MILFSKIFAIVLAVLVISKSLFDYRKKQDSFLTLVFWSVAWVGIAYVAINPRLFYLFALNLSNEHVGIGTFVGIAFVFLFYLTYRIYIKAHRLEIKIKEIVMKIGIKDLDKE